MEETPEGTGIEPGKMLDLPTVHKAYLVEKTYGETTVRCGVCRQACEDTGGRERLCETRLNVEGELYTLTYGDVLAAESRPVEMKPFFHYHPGKSMMTICGPSCNLRCPWCQNHELSRAVPRPLKAGMVQMREVVDAAAAAGDIGICVSFTEPLMLFEYCLGLFRESGVAGHGERVRLKRLHDIGRAPHARPRGPQRDQRRYQGLGRRIPRAVRWARGRRPRLGNGAQSALEMGVHVEVVHLVVTGLNDDEEEFREVCRKHLEYGGPGVPLHITAYRPAFEYDKPATSRTFP